MSVSCYEQNPEAIRDALLDGCGGENLENAVIALAAIVDHLQARLKKVEGTGQQATNMPSAAAIQQAIDANVECVDTPNGKYLNRQQVMDCLNALSGTSHVGGNKPPTIL